MPRLNYTVKPHQVLVGGGGTAPADFDITAYLDAIDVNTPEPEVGQALTYTGNFEVSYNSAAIADGLIEDDFSPYVHPERWRTDRQLVLRITNAVGAIGQITLRIEKYAYDKLTRRGRGTLRQIIDSVDRERPSEINITGASASGGVNQQGINNQGACDPGTSTVFFGGSLAATITILAQRAFSDTGVPARPVLLSGVWGQIFDKISTRNPIADANRLLGTCWRWFICDRFERFVSIVGDPFYHPVLFRRSLLEYEATPDLENISNFTYRVLVTGSYQRPECPEERCNATDDATPKEDLDSKQRPIKIKSTSTATFAEVFQDTSLSMNLTTQERKTIIYQYGNYDAFGDLVSQWTQTSFDSAYPEVNSFIPTIPLDEKNDGVVGTITIQERPSGAIFTSLGQNTTLRIAQLTIESERRKTILKPAGVVNSSLGNDFSLVASPDEIINTTSASRPRPTGGAPLDPNNPNGPKKCVEQGIQAEQPGEAPKFEMRSFPVKGETTILPTNWAPILTTPLVNDFGFLPSQGHAQFLSLQIARREIRRLDSYAVKMPVPDEWIAADCPGYFRCHLDDAEYEATAVTLILGENGDRYEMFLKFQANRVGAATAVPSPAAAPPYVPIGTELALTIDIGEIVGIAGDPAYGAAAENGAGATADATVSGGAVTAIAVTDGGGGYTAPPAIVIFGDGTGAVAVATVVGGVVAGITVLDPGTGYTTPPTIALVNGDTGTGATATAAVSGGAVTGIAVGSGGTSYNAPPTVVIAGGGGTGATATATVVDGVVTAVTITSPGTGYTTPPTVTLVPAASIPGTASTAVYQLQGTGGGGSGATATATVSGGALTAIAVNTGGSDYVAPPTVVITGDGSGATATAVISGGVVTGITIDNPGSGYTTPPTIALQTVPPTYTYSSDPANPSFISVNSSTGAVLVDYRLVPPGGYSGTATFVVSDGLSTQSLEIPVNIEPAYAVVPDANPYEQITWQATAFAGAIDAVQAEAAIAWQATGFSNMVGTPDPPPSTSSVFNEIVVDSNGEVVTSGGLVVSTTGNTLFDKIVVDSGGEVVTSGGDVVTTDGDPLFDLIVVDSNGKVVTSGGYVVTAN